MSIFASILSIILGVRNKTRKGTAMSFTADELQSFNDILDRKLAIHRQEMERTLEQRLQILRREIEQRLLATQQEMTGSLTQKLTEEQKSLQTLLHQKFSDQQITLTQSFSTEVRQRQQQQQPQLEGMIDRALAAQLLAIAELLNQRLALPTTDDVKLQPGEQPQSFGTIEVQTDLAWEDLLDIFGKALDERFATLNEATQAMFSSWRREVSTQLAALRPQPYTGSMTNMQEVFQSIEQLEHLIESLQVAMTANHAMLSNRLYHHQQLPLERAHVSNRKSATPVTPASQIPPNSTGSHTSQVLTGEHER
jgi:hypothetical protein